MIFSFTRKSDAFLRWSPCSWTTVPSSSEWMSAPLQLNSFLNVLIRRLKSRSFGRPLIVVTALRPVRCWMRMSVSRVRTLVMRCKKRNTEKRRNTTHGHRLQKHPRCQQQGLQKDLWCAHIQKNRSRSSNSKESIFFHLLKKKQTKSRVHATIRVRKSLSSATTKGCDSRSLRQVKKRKAKKQKGDEKHARTKEKPKQKRIAKIEMGECL